MKILITGATGLVGKAVCKSLYQEGHEISILSRRANADIYGLDIKVHQWRDCKTPPPSEAFEDIDGIINLMGEAIFGGYFSKRKKKAVWDSRVTATQQISQAVKHSGRKLKFYLGASAIGYYRFSDQVQNEDSQAGDHWLSTLCQAWEEAHNSVPSSSHCTVRIGLVLSHSAELITSIMKSGLCSIIPRFGSGKQIMSWIHLEDLKEVICDGVKGKIEGPVNAVSPNNCTANEFNSLIKGYFNRPIAILPVPNAIMRRIAGEPASVILQSQNILPTKLQAANFNFAYSKVNEALKDSLGLSKNPRNQDLEPCFTFEAHQYIPLSKEEVWPFFSDPHNLEKITPEALHFKIINISDNQIQAKSLIEYRLRLRGIPIHWKTLIDSFEPNKEFVDTQTKGPYRIWHHTHTFTPCRNGTIMTDRVRYQLPLLPFGIIALPLIAREIGLIFSYRRQSISKELH